MVKIPSNIADRSPENIGLFMNHDHASIRKLETSLVSRLCAQSSLLSFSDIVRELVNNAVDASAKNIIVCIDLTALNVVVLDDGEGISQVDFPLIANRNYTSRDQSFNNFGYKGEALHHINASLDLYIESRIIGETACSRGSRPNASFSPNFHLSSLGTIAAVTNAFGKIPVRQSQAMQTPKLKHIESIRRAIFCALCMRPEIELSIQTQDGSLGFQIPRGSLTSTERYCCLIGLIFGSSLLPSYETIQSENRGCSLTGMVGLAAVVSPKYQFFFVNGHAHRFSTQQRAEISRLFWRHGFGSTYNRYPVFVVSVNSGFIEDRFTRFDAQDKWLTIWKMLMTCFEGYLSSEGYFPSKPYDQLRVSSPRKLTATLLAKETQMQVLRSNFDSIRIIGQFDKKFIVMLVDANGKDVMCMADQHACDERIKVEQQYRAFVEQVLDPHLNLRLRLEYPISFTLLLSDAHLFSHHHFSMMMLGIDYIVKRGTVLLTHLPLVLIESLRKTEASVIGSMLTAHIHDLHSHRKSSTWTTRISDWYQAVPHLPRLILDALNSQACNTALKFGTQILRERMSQLVYSWKQCRAPHACAHGRPCLIPIKEF